MGALRSRRPSAALVVAIIGVILALGGSAYAGSLVAKNSVGTRQLRNSSVTTKKIKNHAVTAKKINTKGLIVPGSIHANVADNASHANSADSAGSAQPTAFAHVSSAGVLDSANSKNAGSVTKVGTSLYCFSGIPFTVRGGQATIDFGDSNYDQAEFGLGTASNTCPSGTQAFVFTAVSSNNGPAQAAAFFVSFYG